MRRQRMSRRSSRKQFRKGFNKQHSKNRWTHFGMRGGIRL